MNIFYIDADPITAAQQQTKTKSGYPNYILKPNANIKINIIDNNKNLEKNQDLTEELTDYLIKSFK